MYFGSMYVELCMNIVHVTVDIGAVHILYAEMFTTKNGCLRKDYYGLVLLLTTFSGLF